MIDRQLEMLRINASLELAKLMNTVNRALEVSGNKPFYKEADYEQITEEYTHITDILTACEKEIKKIIAGTKKLT